ncbi:MAG TPA: CAP domain-containing protein [Solirubrobacteraceae bacterium]|nr:CAP domain-containing protein [Solirubrobacteraceae bacterium]
MLSLALAGLALVLPAGAQADGACQNTDARPTAENLDEVRGAVLCLQNQERAGHDLAALRENPRLRVAASRHTDNMVQARFFEHTTPSGTTMVQRIRKAGYLNGSRAWSIGENIAWGTGRLATAAEIHAAWMRSPGHRANILRGEYREIGIGVELGVPVQLSVSQLGATFTTDFGFRR